MKRLLSILISAVAVTVAAGGAPAAQAQGRTVGRVVDDATITTALKAKLVKERAKNLVAVNVDTDHGVVHLKGTVPTERDRAEAERLARATKGVVDVRNDLLVDAAAASLKTR